MITSWHGMTRTGDVSVWIPSRSTTLSYYSSIPVAIGDTVDVELQGRVVEGQIDAFGRSSGYGGPVKDILALKVVPR